MPGIKISDLGGPVNLNRTDEFPIARGGATFKTNASSIFDRIDETRSVVSSLSSNLLTVNNSSTIDLFFDSATRTLSAELARTLDLSTRVVILPPVIATPPGLVCPFAAISAPIGWLECNGNVVPNGVGTVQGKTYDFRPLYNVLGSTYGSLGRLPDLRGHFIRGYGVNNFDPSIRSGFFGQQQRDSFQGHKHAIHDPTHAHPIFDPSHNHPINDPGHAHPIFDPTHAHSIIDPSHSHGVSDPGHKHGYRGGKEAKADSKHGDDSKSDDNGRGKSYDTTSERTNISINNQSTGISIVNNSTGIVVLTNTTSIDVLNNTTGIVVLNDLTGVRVQNPISDGIAHGLDPAGSLGASGGLPPRVSHETRPNNIAMLYCIKY